MAPRRPKATKEKPIFKSCVIALAGDITPPEREKWTEADVARWITTWGGVFSAKMEDNVTHILTTEKQFKDRNNSVVKAALKKEKTDKKHIIHIVTADWLEDSITKKKRLQERDYSLQKKQKESNAKKRALEREKKGVEIGERLVNPNLHHVYSDSTYFRYEVILTCDDEENEVVGQKYILTLWESNSKPSLYNATAKFYRKPRDSNPAAWRAFDTPQLFDAAFAQFKKLFKKFTGLVWDDRIASAGSMGKDKFQYEPPSGGKPVGLVHGKPYTPSIFGNGCTVVIPASDALSPNKENGKPDNGNGEGRSQLPAVEGVHEGLMSSNGNPTASTTTQYATEEDVDNNGVSKDEEMIIVDDGIDQGIASFPSLRDLESQEQEGEVIT